MYPHERSLVKRLESKPFALVGVNSDDDQEQLKAVMKKEGLTWRSFWDGGGVHGPIATQWNVHGWPTTYVLDSKGVIRYRYVQGKGLDEAVDLLLAELENEKKPGTQP